MTDETPISERATLPEPRRRAAPDSARANLASPETLQLWLPIFLAAGLLWRLIRYALNFPLWGDEAMLASNLLDHGIFDIHRPLQDYQVAPPLFLILTQALRLALSSAEWVLRLLPLLAGLSALALFHRFVRKHLDPLAAVTALALLAVSFAPVLHSAEFKPYSLDLLCGVAFLSLGWRILQHPAQPAPYLLLALLTPLAFSLSYPSILLFAGLSLALLPTIFRQASRPCRALYALANLLALATLAILIPTVIAAQLRSAGPFMHAFWLHAFPPHDLWSFLPWLYRVHSHALFAYPLKNSETLALLLILLFFLGSARLIARRQLPFLTLLLAPFALTFLAACLQRYPYGGAVRLQQHLAPAVFTLTGLGLSSLLQFLAAKFPARPIALLPHILFAALLVLTIRGILYDFEHPYLHSTNDQTARTLAHSLRAKLPPAAPLYIPQPLREIPPVFAWYLRQNITDIRFTAPPITDPDAPPPTPPTPSTGRTPPAAQLPPSPTPFALLDCPVLGNDPAPPPLWQRTTLLDETFLHRATNRPCRIYLYEPPPAPAPSP